MSLDLTFNGRLRLPLIVAPMFLVSNPAMALAACSQGVMGSFPAHGSRTLEGFESWLDEMKAGLSVMDRPGPWAVNLVVHPTNVRMKEDLDLCIRHQVPVILTSKGAPADVFDRIHGYGGIVFHDVASARHAEKAAAAGADALIAVCGGAGGHTGTLNPFALLNEIRDVTDKPIVLAGGLSTGRDILAAEAMGASLVYMGTRFQAAAENLSDEETRQLLIDSAAKDVFFSAAVDGAPANFLIPTLLEQGFDLEELAITKPGAVVAATTSASPWSKIKSAGHGVGMIKSAEATADICGRLIEEYTTAKENLRRRLNG